MPHETPHSGGGAFAPYKRFGPAAQNLGAGRIHSARAFQIQRGPRGMGHPVGKCGITFEKFQDIKEGDIVEAYLMEQIEV